MIARPEQRRVLYLVHRFPCPPDKGDRIRTYNIIRFLAARCRLSVATLADEPVHAENLAAVSEHCDDLHVAPLRSPSRWIRAGWSLLRGRTVSEGAFASPELSRTLRRWSRDRRFDAVLVSSSSMLAYLSLPELRDVPAVADLIDVDSEKWRQYATSSRGPSRLLYSLEARRLRAIETALPRSVRAVTLVSPPEADLYRRLSVAADDLNVHALTNGVDLDYFRPHEPPVSDGPPTLIFVGAMDYHPNVDAVRWFCREVWPNLRRSRPYIRFEIVGRRPTEEVRRLAGVAGVTVTGAVPDVRPHLARAAVVVAPLRIARGIQNKVLEAMAAGRPVVASPQALEGLDVRRGEQALAAEGPSEWTTALSDLLDRPELQQRLGASARRYVERHHDWKVRLAPLADLLELAPPSQRCMRQECAALS
jgi:sugar transferase (PEP-CTERM/EpsH1 system associated)